LANAIRQSDLRAACLGVNVAAVRIVVLAWSGLVAGTAGAAYVIFYRQAHTGLLHWSVSAEALMHAYFGGLGTIAGPVVGAATITLVKERIGEWTHFSGLFTGVLLLAVILANRRGLLPLLLDGRWRQWPSFLQTIRQRKRAQERRVAVMPAGD
jgi:branched-chain amino acid transport system permease protein